MKSWKKLSEKLLCDVWLPLTELQLYFVELFCGIWELIFLIPYKYIGTNEISSVRNWKEAFWETAMCSVTSSHRVTSFPSRSLSLRLFLWNWQRDIWKPIEGYGEKGNIFRSKLERSFLRNCSVFYWFISQSYFFPRKKPFAMTVLVDFAKWYLEAHRGLWRKRKCLPLKTEKKLSEKLLCRLLFHLTELQLTPQVAFR